MSNRKWVDCSTCGTSGEIEVWDEEEEALKLVACPSCGGVGDGKKMRRRKHNVQHIQ